MKARAQIRQPDNVMECGEAEIARNVKLLNREGSLKSKYDMPFIM